MSKSYRYDPVEGYNTNMSGAEKRRFTKTVRDQRRQQRKSERENNMFDEYEDVYEDTY